ncbi:hypothetical protein YPPY64_4791 [Yersinia pestis PY-64]|nr:hypothetical protein YPPY52_4734 [Yersinia pestis PY-52]EIS52453.1 hypothetical protein YPPY64_4791 [Yersinia pestis PY-64]EIS73591.1 hypothetical protein YPPY72_4674 [Yersinia pestis PY-72]EIS88939.1 hypothetical protein YPPY89_4906 [Yersinia pestis PY-89]EIT07084.1 hypothetical protein YPPY91_1149 [Yersinia pestis PY-91]
MLLCEICRENQRFRQSGSTIRVFSMVFADLLLDNDGTSILANVVNVG